MTKKVSIISLAVIVVAAVLIFAITKNDNQEQLTEGIENVSNVKLEEHVKRNLEQIAKNIASPVEIASTLKDYNFEYSNQVLLECNISDFVLNREKAIALGGIGVDLMFINYYEKKSDLLTPLNQVRKLSNELHISQFFDYDILKQLTSSTLTRSNIDSLIFVTTYNLNQIESYLLKSQREDLGVFMVVGAWTEGIHLLAQYAAEHRDEKLNEKVAEQHFFLLELKKLLAAFENDKQINKILAELGKVEKKLTEIEFEEINIGEPVKKLDIDGNEVMYQNTTTKAILSDKQLDEIALEVERFRNKIFKQAV
ncbi:MAG: hypothetical protein MI922_13635 [Bacteroidales bacterium]|nr:hypothetical protein [Bacteroidales bacterium]